MRYKTVACILLILSIFSFVLPTPIPVREVREACADAVEGGENVKIVSGKRAPRGNPYDGEESDSDTTPGGTEVPLDEGTTTESQPASSSKTKSVSWGHTTKVHFYDDEPDTPDLPAPPGREGYLAKVAAQQSLLPDVEHAPLSSYFGPPPPPEPHFYDDEPDTPDLPAPPGREGYLSKVAGQQSPLPEVKHAPPSSYFDPPPQSKGLVSYFKTFFGKLGKLKFRKVPAYG
ncbi:hypothetical protein V8E52_007025 [Russula decolorans]|jgi:hypothetical protein